MSEISEKEYKDEGVTRPFTRAPVVFLYEYNRALSNGGIRKGSPLEIIE